MINKYELSLTKDELLLISEALELYYQMFVCEDCSFDMIKFKATVDTTLRKSIREEGEP